MRTIRSAKEWLAGYTDRRYRDDNGAFIVGLSGHLGAGKTAFVKVVAKELGIEETVTSPTFVIMKMYETKDDVWKRLVHIDAYRLERRSELEGLKWEDVVSDPHNLVMIEWPENVGLGKDDMDSLLGFEIKDGSHLIFEK